MRRSYGKFLARLESVALLRDVEYRSLAHNVTLRNLYDGPDRAPSVIAARRAVYAWLKKKGRGNNEIARLFDRSNGSISRLTRNGA